MAYKESLVERLKIAAQKMAVGSMDPMPHIIALSLEDKEIALEVEERIKGKMIGTAQLLSTGGDLQSGIEGIVELPIYSDNPDDILKEPICLFANLKSKKVALVNRPENKKLTPSVMALQPFVTGAREEDERSAFELNSEAQARENNFFNSHGMTPYGPIGPGTSFGPSSRPLTLEEIIEAILAGRNSDNPIGSASPASTSTTCNAYTGAKQRYDGREQDDPGDFSITRW